MNYLTICCAVLLTINGILFDKTNAFLHDDTPHHKKVIIHVPVVTRTVYKVVEKEKGGGEHKHKGEVVHHHHHGGKVDHIHKHEGEAAHKHEHIGHAGHSHKHTGAADHKHLHAGKGEHNHGHKGHIYSDHHHVGSHEHDHKHHGSHGHAHTHSGVGHHSHKHSGEGIHGHSHSGHFGHGHHHVGSGDHSHGHYGHFHADHHHDGRFGHQHGHIGHAAHKHDHIGHFKHNNLHNGQLMDDHVHNGYELHDHHIKDKYTNKLLQTIKILPSGYRKGVIIKRPSPYDDDDIVISDGTVQHDTDDSHEDSVQKYENPSASAEPISSLSSKQGFNAESFNEAFFEQQDPYAENSMDKTQEEYAPASVDYYSGNYDHIEHGVRNKHIPVINEFPLNDIPEEMSM